MLLTYSIEMLLVKDLVTIILSLTSILRNTLSQMLTMEASDNRWGLFLSDESRMANPIFPQTFIFPLSCVHRHKY